MLLAHTIASLCITSCLRSSLISSPTLYSSGEQRLWVHDGLCSRRGLLQRLRCAPSAATCRRDPCCPLFSRHARPPAQNHDRMSCATPSSAATTDVVMQLSIFALKTSGNLTVKAKAQTFEVDQVERLLLFRSLIWLQHRLSASWWWVRHHMALHWRKCRRLQHC